MKIQPWRASAHFVAVHLPVISSVLGSKDDRLADLLTSSAFYMSRSLELTLH
jgi:hypothetical protein